MKPHLFSARIPVTKPDQPVYGTSIPKEIREELDYITDFTKKSNREAIIAVCQKPGRDKYFVAGFEKGNKDTVKDPVCNQHFGKSIEAGTIHTHPVLYDTVGTTPSDTDLISTMIVTKNYSKRQTDCITNHKAKFVHCYMPNRIPTDRHIEAYINSAESANYATEDKYIADNVTKDFEHFYYDRKSGNLVEHPDANDLVKDALETSRPQIRKTIKVMERGTFCDWIQDRTMPGDDAVGQRCRVVLRDRKIFGIPIEH